VRYFLHLDDGIPNNDLVGIEPQNLNAVRRELTSLCGEMLADAGLRSLHPDWRVRVTDEKGREVLSVTLQGKDAEKGQATRGTTTTLNLALPNSVGFPMRTVVPHGGSQARGR
jgi:hypothetical protein